MPRRAILAALAAAVAAVSTRAGWASHGPAIEAFEPGRLLSDLEGARAIGTRYLQQSPDEARPEILARCLFPGTAGAACGPAALDRLRQALDEQRRRDFTAGDTVLIDGWILARTEARLCALASLA
jgi:hypothetical protein